MLNQISLLTHSYLETRKRVLGKECRPRSDATLSPHNVASDKGVINGIKATK